MSTTNELDELIKVRELNSESSGKEMLELILSWAKRAPEQRTVGWFEQRSKTLTASIIEDFIKGSEYTTVSRAIQDKALNKKFVGSAPCEFGTSLEEIAALYFEETFHVKLKHVGLIRHPNYDFISASPDGLFIDPGTETETGTLKLLEIKCPISRAVVNTIDDIPSKYITQMQTQMEVCNIEHCIFADNLFKRFEDYDKFMNELDPINDLTYGIILSCKDSKLTSGKFDDIKYFYPPMRELDVKKMRNSPEFNTFLSGTYGVQPISHVNINVLYYTLKKVKYIEVNRDHKWFGSVIDKLKLAWEKVLEVREREKKRLEEKLKNLSVSDDKFEEIDEDDEIYEILDP